MRSSYFYFSKIAHSILFFFGNCVNFGYFVFGIDVLADFFHSDYCCRAGGRNIGLFHIRIDGVERSIFKNPVAAFACRFCGKALTLKFLAYMITDFGLYNAVDVLHGYAAVADHLV